MSGSDTTTREVLHHWLAEQQVTGEKQTPVVKHFSFVKGSKTQDVVDVNVKKWFLRRHDTASRSGPAVRNDN